MIHLRSFWRLQLVVLSAESASTQQTADTRKQNTWRVNSLKSLFFSFFLERDFMVELFHSNWVLQLFPALKLNVKLVNWAHVKLCDGQTCSAQLITREAFDEVQTVHLLWCRQRFSFAFCPSPSLCFWCPHSRCFRVLEVQPVSLQTLLPSAESCNMHVINESSVSCWTCGPQFVWNLPLTDAQSGWDCRTLKRTVKFNMQQTRSAQRHHSD